MQKILAVLVLFLTIFQFSHAQKNERKDELKPYFVVILKKGPNRDQDSTTAARIQKKHLEHINKMAASGKLNVAGPFLHDGDMKGIFIFDVNSEDEVKHLVDSDPAVKAGRLIYEIYPWMTQRGTCFK